MVKMTDLNDKLKPLCTEQQLQAVISSLRQYVEKRDEKLVESRILDLEKGKRPSKIEIQKVGKRAY